MISKSDKLKTEHKNQVFPFVLISTFKYLLKRLLETNNYFLRDAWCEYYFGLGRVFKMHAH